MAAFSRPRTSPSIDSNQKKRNIWWPLFFLKKWPVCEIVGTITEELQGGFSLRAQDATERSFQNSHSSAKLSKKKLKYWMVSFQSTRCWELTTGRSLPLLPPGPHPGWGWQWLQRCPSNVRKMKAKRGPKLDWVTQSRKIGQLTAWNKIWPAFRRTTYQGGSDGKELWRGRILSRKILTHPENGGGGKSNRKNLGCSFFKETHHNSLKTYLA